MSRGDTSPVPRMIEYTSGRWSDRGMPSLYAICTVRCAPMSIENRANTALIEPSSASCRFMSGTLVCSALFTVQVQDGEPKQFGNGYTNGDWPEYIVVSGSMPRS